MMEKSLGKIDARGALVVVPVRICFQNSPFYSCMLGCQAFEWECG